MKCETCFEIPAPTSLLKKSEGNQLECAGVKEDRTGLHGVSSVVFGRLETPRCKGRSEDPVQPEVELHGTGEWP